MNPAEILTDMEETIDRLIDNSRAIGQLSTEDEALSFQKAQSDLLDHLMRMDSLLDREDKQHILQEDRELYTSLEEKIEQFSVFNLRGLKKKNRLIKR